ETSWLAALTPTALVNRRAKLPRHEMSERSAKAVWVPNRNGCFIEIAAAHAESMDAERLITGFNREEAATFPDNSKAYVGAVNGETRRNPVSVEETLAAIRSLGPHPWVSFTGGEPVLQAEFVREVALGARALGMKTYLDTSGTLADRLARCADAIDLFAFDV